METIRKIWVVAALVLLPAVSWAENKPENKPENEIKTEDQKVFYLIHCALSTTCDDGKTVVSGSGSGPDHSTACARALANALNQCPDLTQ